MNNLYVIVAILFITIIGTILFRNKAFKIVPVEVVMLGFGILLGPYGINLLNKSENIQIEPVITLLIGVTAIFAGLKFRFKNINMLKKLFILTFTIFSIAFLLSLTFFYFVNHFQIAFRPKLLIILAVLSASIIPSYYCFSKDKKTYTNIISIISNLMLIIIFILLIFLTPLFENKSPLTVNYWYSILFSVLDLLVFSAIMFFLFRNSRDQNEFIVVFSGISIFNVVICYIFGINAASAMFFIGFILTNTMRKEYFRFKDIIKSLEHPFYIGLLMLTGSYLTFDRSIFLSIPYLFIHPIAIFITLLFFRHYIGKFKYGVIPQTGILYTILLSLIILNNESITTASSSIILANMLLYIPYYFMREG